MSSSTAKRYASLKARGICKRCTTRPATQGTCCADCYVIVQQEARDYNRRRRERRRPRPVAQPWPAKHVAGYLPPRGSIAWQFLGRVVTLTALLLAVAAPGRGQTPSPCPIPPHTGYVTDTAGMLAAEGWAALNRQLTDYEHESTNEVAIVTIPSDGGDIKGCANAIFHAWGVGKQGQNNGVLLVWAVSERHVRIEVGYGLEGVLPDGRAGQILRAGVLPEFRAGRWLQGLTVGVTQIIDVLRTDQPPPAPVTSPDPFWFWFWVVVIVIVVLLVVLFVMAVDDGYGGGSGFRSSGSAWGGSSGSWGSDSSSSSSSSSSFGGGDSGGGGADGGY